MTCSWTSFRQHRHSLSSVCRTDSYLFKHILFMYLFCLHWVFVAVLGLLWLLQVELLLAAVCGLLIKGLLLLWSTGSVAPQVQVWLQGSKAQTQQLRFTSLTALLHVRSFWTKDGTYFSCIGRWILHCWAVGNPAYIYVVGVVSWYHFWRSCDMPQLFTHPTVDEHLGGFQLWLLRLKSWNLTAHDFW